MKIDNFSYEIGGKKIEIIGTYTCNLRDDLYEIGNLKINYGKVICERGSLLLYRDGKLIDQCYIPGLFKLIDSHGIKKIWGLKVSFKTEEFVKKYNEWLSNLITPELLLRRKNSLQRKMPHKMQGATSALLVFKHISEDYFSALSSALFYKSRGK